MVAFGEFVRVDVLHVTTFERGRLIISGQGFARLVPDWPPGALVFGRLAAIVAGTTDLNRHPHGELGRVDDRLTLLKDFRLR